MQTIIKAGVGRDGYWQIDDVVEQVKHAIEAFEIAFPNAVGVWIFDHSSNHMAWPADALRAVILNKGDFSIAKDRPAPSRDGMCVRGLCFCYVR